MSDTFTIASSVTPAKSGRSAYLDVLRGWAIILVVLGHAAQRATHSADAFAPTVDKGVLAHNWLTLGIFSFGAWHMPLFMGISGYLAWGRVRRPITRWLGTKALQLLVPFVSWMLVYFVVHDQFLNTTGGFWAYVSRTLTNPGNGLWYLPVLFFFYVIVAVAEQSPFGDALLIAVGVVISALPATTFLGIVQMQLVWWWFVAGYLLAKRGGSLTAYRWPVWITAVLVCPIAYYGLKRWGPGWTPLLELAGIAVSTFVVWVFMRVRLTRPLAYVGRHTLEVYAGEFLFLSLPLLSGGLRIPALTVVAVLGSLAVGALLRLTPLTNLLFLGGRYTSSKPFHEAPPADVLAGGADG